MKLRIELLTYLFISLHFSLSLQCQDKNNVLECYLHSNESGMPLNLAHGPIEIVLETKISATFFFIKTVDTTTVRFVSYGVLHNSNSNEYFEFGHAYIDPTFGDGVISVFFENIDEQPDKELIVIYEHGNRTFYGDGGYAGIKNSYQTRVFKYSINPEETAISEYKTIGELLTVNLPLLVGTRNEEKLIGRDLNAINSIVGITRNATAVRKRIQHLKQYGLLGNTQ